MGTPYRQPTGSRLLIITYYFPPETSVGAHRWRAMSRWLRRLGHEVTILTTRAFGTLPDDIEGTERTFDLAGSTTLRRLLRRPELDTEPAPAEGAPPHAAPPGAEGRSQKVPAILGDLLVPDAQVLGWDPAAAQAARRLVRERRIDCVITSGPPHSTHLIPLALGHRRPAWIADFRDGWGFEPLRGPWPLPGQARLDAYFERKVVEEAEAVIGVTRPIADDLVTRLGARSIHVPNGWDPELDGAAAEAAVPALEPDTVTVVHAGRLYVEGTNRRDPSSLGPALRRLLARRPEAAERLRIVIAGPLEVEEEHYLAELDPADMVRHVGHLPRESLMALERRADALLLVTAPKLFSLATGKLFEYLAAGAPIIALAQGNDASRIVEETGTGVTMPVDDVEGLADALEAALDGRLGEGFDPHGLDPYLYPAPTQLVEELVEQAIAERAEASR